MFKKIYYYCDENGNPLDKPRILNLKDVNAKAFTMSSCSDRRPSVHISRVYKNAEGDIYNDDGRPATMLTEIVLPVVTFMGNYIEVIGFESPNLVLAGLASESYDKRHAHRYPKKGELLAQEPIWMQIERRGYADVREMKNLFPQKLLLVA